MRFLVIMCASPKKVREILLAAEDMGMMSMGEYVFFNVELFTSQKTGFDEPWNDPSASDEENDRARRAYEAVLTVTARTSDTQEYSEFAKAVTKLSMDKFNYNYTEPVNTFVANFHDAVLLYATALKETIDVHGIEAKARGDYIVQRMWNRTITGVSGNVSIDANGDRSADYTLLDMDPTTGKFRVVAVYEGKNNHFDLIGKIHWPARDKPPPDTPLCGFDGSLCIDEPYTVYIILSTVLSVVVIVLIIISLLIYRYFSSQQLVVHV